jgi:small subunit ribosomal protein S4
VRKLAKESMEERSSYSMPGWLNRDPQALSGKVTSAPTRADVTFEVREQLVVELMSK